jgi:anaerobic selenocysteine-containing dehydrogenase
MDETTAQADIVLPSHTYLESWGDVLPEPGVGFTVGAVSQPVVSPLYDTKGTGDTVLALAARLGMHDALPWVSMEDCLKGGWRAIYERAEPDGSDFDGFWRDVLMSGVWGENTRADQSVTVDSNIIGVADPDFAGDGSFHLHPFLSTAMRDGRGANLPWMQELPDPITTVVYGSWVEMNPSKAAELGISDGDVVSVTSEHGSVEAPVVLFPAIRPDVVAMPIGQGHDSYGRYAQNRGANPISILAPATDGAGGLAACATRVSITRTGRRAPPVRTGGESRQLGRNIVQTTGDNGAHAKLNSIPIVVEPA